ncbi:C-myc promoter-binding protein-like [Gigantopelta aegis]|uniref:C-myc promoter-binding protein-like n=1 Tax=Gigantopelta aegis TaxID=1735272 RepID=UPI001B88911A|nr:C-myc promoter-binding protein-like [Gigantopelta aegis]
MDEKRVVDYFVVAGLSDNPLPLQEFFNEAAIKPTFKQDPITDVTIINKNLGERTPVGYQCIDVTPNGFPADLNHGSIRCPEMYICFKRGRHKPPLTDIGVLYEGREKLIPGCEVVHTTSTGNPANVNNGSSFRIYITYRRALESAASDTLAVTDICVILSNKNEEPPLAYNKISKNLNKGVVGSDVFVCYKKSMNKTDVISYKPEILDRYPEEDYENFPMPDSVPMFCLPMGATVESWPAKAQHPLPIFSTFILTVPNAKVYGAAVTFYEEYGDGEVGLSDLQLRSLGLKNKHIREQYRVSKTIHTNKSICLLSHWPFFDAFKKFLSYLYKNSITGPHTVPLERQISHFMFNVPYPSPERPRILIQLNNEALSLCMPEDSPLPQNGSSFITLLKNMGPDNCLSILYYVMIECKILIHSLRPAVLTGVAEAVTSMIFPFHWQCPYIPLCPLTLSGVLSAPCPYIVGIDSRYFDLHDPPPDVICVDLDTNRICLPEEKKGLGHKMLPKKPARVLLESLHRLFDILVLQPDQPHTTDEVSLEMAPIDYDFKRKNKEMKLELQIQEAFLRFTASLLKGYKNYLNPILERPTLRATDAAVLFDMPSKCYTNHSVDETKDEPKLIEIEHSHKSERTVFITPPEPTGLPTGMEYSYNGFPQLNPELFLPKAPSVASLGVKSLPLTFGSLVRRTKQEMRSAQKTAHVQILHPQRWAKCLLSYCYSLWFVHLPSYISTASNKMDAFKIAYAVLQKMHNEKLPSPDEMCYRVLMQLCGQYNKPGLAIKVFLLMKRYGIHPNAITYGFYNKVMLEAKWPSRYARGVILWTKLRNVIRGIAQFRNSVRYRRTSTCSYSGSECDKISHTSEDSYLEEASNSPKPDVQDSGSIIQGIHKGCIEESLSTGGASDRGYSSMTQEDVKQISQHINSGEGSSDSSKTKEVKPIADTRRRSMQSDKRDSEEVCHRPSCCQRRLGSIVLRSGNTMSGYSNVDTVKGSIINNSAGLLMVSQSSLEHHTFNLSRDAEEFMDKKRRRHKSVGEFVKMRSNSLFASWRPRHSSGDDKMLMRFSELQLKERVVKIPENVSADDSVFTNSAEYSSQKTKDEKDSGVELNENHMLFSDSDEHTDPKHTRFCDNSLSNGATCNRSTSLHDDDGDKPIFESTRKAHTPCTENDPLGHFTGASVLDSAPLISFSPSHSPKSLVSLCTSTPYPTVLNHSKETDGDSVCKQFSDSSSSADPSSLAVKLDIHGLVEPSKRKPDLGRTSSSPNCLADLIEIRPNIPVKSQSMDEDHPPINSTSSLNELGRFEKTSEYLLRRTRSLKKTNEAITGFLKFAARGARGAVNKLNEFKQSMTTPIKDGSTASLSKSIDEDSGTGDESNCATTPSQPKFGSCQDMFSEHSTTDDSVGHGNSQVLFDFGASPCPEDRCESFDVSIQSDSIDQLWGGSDDLAVEVEMSSCSRCFRCHSLMYDEEIMAGWSADESDLNASCQFCPYKFVPNLHIYIKDWRCDGSNTKEKPCLHSEVEKLKHSVQFEDISLGSNSVASHVNKGCKSEQSAVTGESYFDMKLSSRQRSTSECLTGCTESAHSRMSSTESIDTVGQSDTSVQLSVNPSTNQQEMFQGVMSTVTEMQKDFMTRSACSIAPIAVPYLSPIVLRKEIEHILENEGDECMSTSMFVDDHSIVYWNLIWYFKRIDCPSHLPGFLLTASSITKNPEKPCKHHSMYDHRNVLLHPMWDNVRIHDEVGLPLYTSWESGQHSSVVDALVTETQLVSRPVMHQIISNIQCNDVLSPIKLMANSRRRVRKKKHQFRSLYREILFLAFSACGRENIDHDAFDREFNLAFAKLTSAEQRRLQPNDKPKTDRVICCRRAFGDLEI